MKNRVWLVYMGLGIGVGLLYFFGPPIARTGPVFNAVGASAVFAVGLGVWLHKPKARGPWALFALGLALFFGGDLITYNPKWFYGANVSTRNIPYPSLGDLLYVLVYPALMAGILVLIRKRSPGRDRAALLDSVIITTGVGVLSWVYLMAPYTHDASSTLIQKMTSVAYPLGDLLLMGAMVRLAVGRGKRVPAFYLLVASVLSLLVTDSAYGVIRTFNLYGGSGSFLDAGWGAFYLLWGAAALHPSMSELDASVPETDAERHVSIRRLILLAGASLMAPFTQAIQGLRGKDSNGVIVAAASAVLFILVLIRLKGLMVDIAEYRRAEKALQEAELKYRTLVERLPAVIYIDGVADGITSIYVSPQIESILGISQADWLTDWSLHLHPDDKRRAVDEYEQGVSRGHPFSSEYRVIGRDGVVRWVYDEAVVLGAGTGGAVVQGVMLDITQRRRAEEELREHRGALQQALEELHRAQADRSKLFQKTVHAAEEERTRLAADLHDGPIQRLAALGFDLERVKTRCERGETASAMVVLDEVQEGISASVGGLRSVMAELRPPVLSEKGIAAALRDYAQGFSKRSGIACTVDADPDEKLPSQLETVLYRVAQEALTNIAKHARASHVDVRVRTGDPWIELVVSDDGVGFDPNLASKMVHEGHFGLLGMRERVELAGGQWQVQSTPGSGTTVRAVFELQKAAA